MVEANARLVSDLANQVLAFPRGIEDKRAPINLIHLMRQTECMARQTFCPSIEIRTCIDRRLRPVEGDATQLHQVLLNLVVNARDAMPDGETLSLSARNVEMPARARLRRDNGGRHGLRNSRTPAGKSVRAVLHV